MAQIPQCPLVLPGPMLRPGSQPAPGRSIPGRARPRSSPSPASSRGAPATSLVFSLTRRYPVFSSRGEHSASSRKYLKPLKYFCVGRMSRRCCVLHHKVLLVYVSRYNFRCVIRKHYLRDKDHLCFILLLTLSTVLLRCLNGEIYY